MHLMCADGRQILLQARDDTDMQEWVHTINKVCRSRGVLPQKSKKPNITMESPFWVILGLLYWVFIGHFKEIKKSYKSLLAYCNVTDSGV